MIQLLQKSAFFKKNAVVNACFSSDVFLNSLYFTVG